jgi:hypothetical protein
MTSPGREGKPRFFGYYNQAFLSTVDVKLKDFTRNGKEENRGPHAKELGAVVSARARLISASKGEKDDDDDHHCSHQRIIISVFR